jgi:hypothetical protein
MLLASHITGLQNFIHELFILRVCVFVCARVRVHACMSMRILFTFFALCSMFQPILTTLCEDY